MVIALDEILEVQPCGTSESQRGQAALQELENEDGSKTEDEQVDTGTRRRRAGTREIWTAGCLLFRRSSSERT